MFFPQTRTCTGNEFKCLNNNGQCIPREWVCNGNKECVDGSDEESKMCEVRITFGIIIYWSYLL